MENYCEKNTKSEQDSGSTNLTGFLLKTGQGDQHHQGTTEGEQSAGKTNTPALASKKSVKGRTKQRIETQRVRQNHISVQRTHEQREGLVCGCRSVGALD